MGTPKRKSGHDGGGFDGKRKAGSKVLRAVGSEGKGFAGNAATAIPRSPALDGRVFVIHGSGLPVNQGAQAIGLNNATFSDGNGF